MVRTFLFAAALVTAGPAFAAPAAHFSRTQFRAITPRQTLGRVIQARGASSQVRDFGAMLTRDHTQALRQAQQVAAREHLHIRPTMAPEARDELYRLKRLSGPRFNREVRRYMIDDHRKDIAEYREQARDRRPGDAALPTRRCPCCEAPCDRGGHPPLEREPSERIHARRSRSAHCAGPSVKPAPGKAGDRFGCGATWGIMQPRSGSSGCR